MRRLLYIVVCVIVLGVVGTSCENNALNRQLDGLDTLMRVNPDSVHAVLDGMDTRTMSKSQRMRHALLLADAQNKAYIDFTTDSVMLTVADYYDHHGTPNEQMRAHYLLGCTYRDLNDIPMELQCFQEAVEKADTTSKDCDFYTLAAIYGQMANIYHYQFLPKEELRSLAMCEKLAKKEGDTFSAIKAYELRLRAYNILNMPDSVLSISETARAQYLSIGKTVEASLLLAPAIGILIDQERYDEAYEYMELFENTPVYKDSLGSVNHKYAIHLYYKGRYELYLGRIAEAKYCFYKLMEFGETEPAYKGLLLTYQQLHQPDSMAKYALLYAQANDSSFIGMNSEVIAQMTAMYDYGMQRKKAEAAQQQVVISNKVIFMLFVTLMALVGITAILYMYFYFRRKATSLKINSLQADIKHYTLIISDLQNNSNEKMDSLKELLEESKTELAKYKESQTLSAFFDSDIYSTFRKASRNGQYNISETDWANLEILFNNTFSSYSDFIHSGHSMSSAQLYVCMLIRMGFGETEMANILDVDFKRISRIKAQINQKLFNTQSARTLSSNLRNYF